MTARPRLLFVSTRFLFPIDSGGKIRTTQILRGMKGRRFEVTLASPAPADYARRFSRELDGIADRFVHWPQHERAGNAERLRHILSSLPIPVATDRSAAGRKVVAAELAAGFDVVVVDFPHAWMLMPDAMHAAAVVVFTHNVEAEIFERNASRAPRWWWRAIWASQAGKMRRFERRVLDAADAVVAVAERDKAYFVRKYGIRAPIKTIRTGVDFEHFAYRGAGAPTKLVFTGSMDSSPNIDAVRWFVEAVAPLLGSRYELKVVGRAPPRTLVEDAAASPMPVVFTGFVDDVRPEVADRGLCVIPMRLGGGTRLKVFEAMAMGLPVVSTGIGVEGLDVIDGVHYLRADEPRQLAAAIERLAADEGLRRALARRAREHVERECSYAAIAEEFETICSEAADTARRSSCRLTLRVA